MSEILKFALGNPPTEAGLASPYGRVEQMAKRREWPIYTLPLSHLFEASII